jgi:hypothetical protein
LALTMAASVSAGTQLRALALLSTSRLADFPAGLPDDVVPAPDAASVCAAGLLPVPALRMSGTYARRCRLRRDARQVLASASTELVAVPHLRAQAFAVPDRPRGIVPTNQMLRVFSPEHLRVSIEYDQVNLVSRHSWPLNVSQPSVDMSPLIARRARPPVPVRLAGRPPRADRRGGRCGGHAQSADCAS